MKHMKLHRIFLAVTALAALAGCGGGGGGGGSSSSGSGGAFFITDDLNTGYDHVWVTIKKVELAKVGGGTTVVYSDSVGTTVDLRSLRDAQGRRFKLIGWDNKLSGQYNGVTVTLDDDVVLYPSGSTTGQARTFEGSSGGEKALSTTFAARTFGPGNDDLIIDFDLATWNDNGSQVTGANISVVTDDSVSDDSRHDRENYPGTVSNIQGTAPNQTFTLTRGNHSVTVQTSADTEIHRSDSNGNSTLAAGQHVVVRGVFNTTTNMLEAAKIKITDGDNNDDDDDEANGTVSNINALAGSFDLTIEDVEEFQPSGDPIHVATTETTVFRSQSGLLMTKAEFFAALTNGANVEVEGVYNSGTNTLTATKIKLEGDDGDDEDNAEVRGASSNVDAVAFTLKVTATEFSGINVAPGTLVPVVTNGDTTYKGANNVSMTQSAFFTLLTGSPGTQVEVEGHWDGTVLTASKLKIEND